MAQSWMARQMVPGKDNLSTMAMHYGIGTGTIIEVIRDSGAGVIRADGHKGSLILVGSKERLDGTLRNRNRKVTGWDDGQIGVDPATTILTRPAILAVADWKIEQQEDEENGSAA